MRSRGMGVAWWAVFTLSALVGASCGTPPSPAAPAPVASMTPAPLPAATEAPRPQAPVLAEIPSGSLRLAWAAKTAVWNRAVVVAPFGDVVSLGARRIHVHARDTGKVLESGETCYARSRHAMAFVGNDRAVLVCAREVVEVAFPGLKSTTIAEIGGGVTAAAARSDRLAYSLEGGDVRVLDAASGRELERLKAGEEVEDLAWSTDGTMLAMGLKDGRVVVRDRPASVQKEIRSGDRRAGGISFSADDREIFVHNASFEAHVLDPRSGRITRIHRVGPWVSASAPLGPGLFATTGSGGLLLYKAGMDEGNEIPWADGGGSPSCEGLDVSADGSMLCAGDRAGVIACFTTKPLALSGYGSKRAAAD